MDTLLAAARGIGHNLQNDDRFIRSQMAQTACDEDKELQDMIGEFNLKRMSFGNERVKEDRDDEKLKQLDAELRGEYAKIMANPRMAAYQEAKTELDKLVNGIVSIITLSAQGQNPDDIQESSCSGDCAGCAGCH